LTVGPGPLWAYCRLGRRWSRQFGRDWAQLRGDGPVVELIVSGPAIAPGAGLRGAKPDHRRAPTRKRGAAEHGDEADERCAYWTLAAYLPCCGTVAGTNDGIAKPERWPSATNRRVRGSVGPHLCIRIVCIGDTSCASWAGRGSARNPLG
jgi:hypothetical protein